MIGTINSIVTKFVDTVKSPFKPSAPKPVLKTVTKSAKKGKKGKRN